MGDCSAGFATIVNPDGSKNHEKNCYDATTIDFEVSKAAFTTHVYPLLQQNCSGCHSTASGAQAPIHSDQDVDLAHKYALTKVNFRNPETSRFVERLGVDRHNCFDQSCDAASKVMLTAVKKWADAVAPTLKPLVWGVPQGTAVTESQVLAWVAADKAALPTADQTYVRYTSFHEMHNAGMSADGLDLARVGLSKALNTAARWAPEVKNPVDVSDGKGIVYRFDIRDYWGFNKGLTKLPFGGSDDDAAFGITQDYQGNKVTFFDMLRVKFNFAKEVSVDPAFAQLVWERVKAGNVEGADGKSLLPANVSGFKADYVEAGQLTYTLTRPDVYNAIMAIPYDISEFETELGLKLDQGPLSYEYMLTKQAITVDSRMYYRGRISDGKGGETYYWKTWDVFTGQLPNGLSDIDQAYAQGYIRFPFWSNPVPKWVDGGMGQDSVTNFSFLATLAQRAKNGASAQCDGQTNFGDQNQVNCRYYTGEGGGQQSAEEIIWGLPNGLQGYALGGGFNQRRVDAFVNIVRDPRILRPEVSGKTVTDAAINNATDFAVTDVRLNTGSSCIGCHSDGMNRGNNDLRDWLDDGTLGTRIGGAHGVDGWVNDAAQVSEVKKYYPPSSVMRQRMEADRERYFTAESTIKHGMMLSPDKNMGVEPTIYTIEWTRNFYDYPVTRSN